MNRCTVIPRPTILVLNIKYIMMLKWGKSGYQNDVSLQVSTVEWTFFVHLQKPQTCSLCPVEIRTTFDSSDLYKRHLFRKHFFPVLPKPLKCPDCGSSFLVESGFFSHFMDRHLSERMEEEKVNFQVFVIVKQWTFCKMTILEHFGLPKPLIVTRTLDRDVIYGRPLSGKRSSFRCSLFFAEKCWPAKLSNIKITIAVRY